MCPRLALALLALLAASATTTPALAEPDAGEALAAVGGGHGQTQSQSSPHFWSPFCSFDTVVTFAREPNAESFRVEMVRAPAPLTTVPCDWAHVTFEGVEGSLESGLAWSRTVDGCRRETLTVEPVWTWAPLGVEVAQFELRHRVFDGCIGGAWGWRATLQTADTDQSLATTP